MNHNDHLGTPQKMTDASGTVVWAADYKPFGEVNITTNTITNNLRFPGQYFDVETGLLYNTNRDYNQVTGRYIESDSIGIQKGRNHLYTYVKSNPVKYIDPMGLKQCKDCSQVYINCLFDFFVVPGLSNLITAAGDSSGFAATAAAWNHAGAKTLSYPMKSSIVRDLLALGRDLPLLGQLIALDTGLILCAKAEWDCEFN